MNLKLTFSSDTKCCRIRDKLQLCGLSYHTWHFGRGHSLDYSRKKPDCCRNRWSVDAHCFESRVQKSLWTRSSLGDSFSTSCTHSIRESAELRQIQQYAYWETVNSCRCKQTNFCKTTVSCNQYLRWTGQKWGYFVECICCSFTYNESRTRQAQKSTIKVVYITQVFTYLCKIPFDVHKLQFGMSRFQIKFGWCYMLMLYTYFLMLCVF